MRECTSRRSYHRHSTARATHLKPRGHDDWIPLSMIDWSAGGASLSGATGDIPLGPAVLQVSSSHGHGQIQLACKVVWRARDKVGLRLLGPAAH